MAGLSIAHERGIAEPTAKVTKGTLGQLDISMFTTEGWFEEGRYYLYQPDLDLLVSAESGDELPGRLGDLIVDTATWIEGLSEDEITDHERQVHGFIAGKFEHLVAELNAETERLQRRAAELKAELESLQRRAAELESSAEQGSGRGPNPPGSLEEAQRRMLGRPIEEMATGTGGDWGQAPVDARSKQIAHSAA